MGNSCHNFIGRTHVGNLITESFPNQQQSVCECVPPGVASGDGMTAMERVGPREWQQQPA